MYRKISILTFGLLLIAQLAVAATYKVDAPHSKVEFTVKHLVFFDVSGVFTDYEAEIEADPVNKTIQSAKAVIKVDSVDTNEKKRDDHLRSPDFFDAANHPEMSFVSKRVEGAGDDITMHGDLTIRGTTKEVALKGSFRGAIKGPWGNNRAGFAASTVINRQDYGLEWNKTLETGGLVVGDEVTITLVIEAVEVSM